MNIAFLVEDSSINRLNSINLIGERIKTSLQVNKLIALKEEENMGIYQLKRDDDTKIFIECYRVNETNVYLINMIDINEEEKKLFFELISTDKLFHNSIILFDSLSNEFISEQFYKFALLENHIKQYFALILFQKYGCKAYDIIENIKTKEDILNLPHNIKTNLQHIQLIPLIDYITDKRLGGVEYQEYSKAYNPDDLKPLMELLDEDIFEDIVKILSKNKKMIKEYRNVICHNRILNCDKMKEKHCKTIDGIVKKVIELNNINLNNINKTDKITYKIEDLEDKIFTFAMSSSNINKQIQLVLIEILCKLNIIYTEVNMTEIHKDNLQYESEVEGIEINISKVSDDDGETLFICTVKCKSCFKESRPINEIIINELKEYNIVIIYDSISMNTCNSLAKAFNGLENIFREYITLFQYIENIKENYKNDKIPEGLAIGITEKLSNCIYDLDFIELLHIITAPNGGKNMSELTHKLKKSINGKNNKEIQFLLTNMLDYNNDLKIIVKHWCELYRFRTIVAHCGLIQEKDYKKISNIISFTRLTVENILADYLYNNTKIFRCSNSIKIEDIIYIEKSVEEEKLGCCDLRFCKIDGENKSVCKIENIYPFRVIQLLEKIIDDSNNSFEHIFSYEYLEKFINKHKDNLKKIFFNKEFENNLSLILEKLGFDQYASFRIITNEEQKLEEKIGELLNSIHQKMQQEDKQ